VLTAKPSLSPPPIYQLEPGGASISVGHCYGITQSTDKRACQRLWLRVTVTRIRTCYVEIGLSFRRRSDAIRSSALVPATVILVDAGYHQCTVGRHLASDLSHVTAFTSCVKRMLNLYVENTHF